MLSMVIFDDLQGSSQTPDDLLRYLVIISALLQSLVIFGDL